MSRIAERLSSWSPMALSLLRIASALTFLEHGTAKLLGFPVLQAVPKAMSLSWFGGICELVGGALLVLGLFTRPVAFLVSGEMAVAYFSSHMPRNFFPIINLGDAAILYCFIFFYLVFAGAGPLSIDALRKK